MTTPNSVGNGFPSPIGLTELGLPGETIGKRPGKNLLPMGGSSLAAALTELGLIDEYHIVVHPVILGGGKHLLPTKDRITCAFLDADTPHAQQGV